MADRLRLELLNSEIFCTLAETRIVFESWRRFYNTLRPHGSLGDRPPAPDVFIPGSTREAALPQPAFPPALASGKPISTTLDPEHSMGADY